MPPVAIFQCTHFFKNVVEINKSIFLQLINVFKCTYRKTVTMGMYIDTIVDIYNLFMFSSF